MDCTVQMFLSLRFDIFRFASKNGGSFPVLRLPERDVDSSPPFSALGNEWIYSTGPPCAFMAGEGLYHYLSFTFLKIPSRV